MRPPRSKYPTKSGLFLGGFFCPFIDRNRPKYINLTVVLWIHARGVFLQLKDDLCGRFVGALL